MARPSKPKGPCADGCGEIAETRGYSHRCYARWADQGFPAGGPRPPLTASESGRRSAEVRAPEPDPYDLEWYRKVRELRAREPVMRMDRMIAWACRFSAVVRRRDMHGVDVMLHRLTEADKDALLIALAETADPWQLMDTSDGGERRSA